jgi:Ca-activated chloride channel family protein
MSSGLDLGSDLLEGGRTGGRPGRILLLSDGLANAGDSSLSGLMRRAQRAVRGNYVLSTMGIGADFDERVMTALATSGTGAFYYLARLEMLKEFFDAELMTARETYAEGATLRLAPGPSVRVLSVMGLPVENIGNEVVARLGSLYAGHQRRVWVTYQVPQRFVGEYSLGTVAAQFYRQGQIEHVSVGSLGTVACVDSEAVFRTKIVRDVWERAVIEEELTQAQEHFGDAIRSGSKQELDDAVRKAEEHRKLARALGSSKVASKLDSLDEQAKKARSAQSAAPAVRNAEAKRQKASGYHERNKDSYTNADPTKSY